LPVGLARSARAGGKIRSDPSEATLLAPGTGAALAFEHADRLAKTWVKYPANQTGLRAAFRALSGFPGFFACEFVAAEVVHTTLSY